MSRRLSGDNLSKATRIVRRYHHTPKNQSLAPPAVETADTRSNPNAPTANKAPTNNNGVAALFDSLFHPTANTARVPASTNQATGAIPANIGPAPSTATSVRSDPPVTPAANPVLRQFIDSIHAQAPPAPQPVASTQNQIQSVGSTDLVDQDLRGNPAAAVHPQPESEAGTEIIVDS
ncbi:hypothetical protein PtB15_3B439 [Puccinia triticina]|nr:hypothetical protein PtB15_3B439 [Puccinia triticina]